jgi:uncharacterized RDD family membrane protein YckC
MDMTTSTSKGRTPSVRARSRLLPAELSPYQGRQAGVVTRPLAASVDSVVVLLALLAAYFAVQGLRFLLSPAHFRFQSPPRLVGFAVAGIVLVTYLMVSWVLSGQTYGDHLLALRVTDASGRLLKLPRAFVRAVLYAAFPLGLFWSAVSPTRRSVQDLVLRTAVRYEWEGTSGGLVSSG